MTREQFEQVAGPLLAADPFVPVVFELTDGGRVVVDAAEQVSRPPGQTVEVRTPAESRRLSYDQIEGVEAFDRADDRSIRLADFQSALRTLWRDPAQPFSVELTNGRRLAFPRGGGVVFNGRFAVVVAGPGKPLVRFSADQVARIDLAPTARHA